MEAAEGTLSLKPDLKHSDEGWADYRKVRRESKSYYVKEPYPRFSLS